MAKNDILAYIQPVFVDYDMAIAEERIGAHRMPKIYAWKSMLDMGIHACGGSDAPAAEEPEDTVVEGDTSETYAPLATDLANEFLHLVDTAEDPSALTLAEDGQLQHLVSQKSISCIRQPLL